MKVLLPLFALLFCAHSASAVIDLGAASSDASRWVSINYVNTSDPIDDAQTSTGGGEADLIGGEYIDTDGVGPDLSGTYRALYKGFDFGANPGGETSADLDGDETIAFRARVGGDDNPTGFTTALWIGLDLGATGAFDYFIGIYDVSNGTDMGLYQFTEAADTLVDTKKMNYTEVSWAGAMAGMDLSAGTTSDPYSLGSSVGDPDDIDGLGNDDYLVQMELDLSDLAAAMGLTQEEFFNTEIGFGLWTSQNLNQVNNDINGIGDYAGDANLTPSNPYTPSGTEPVPEPSTYAFIFGMLAFAFSASRRCK